MNALRGCITMYNQFTLWCVYTCMNGGVYIRIVWCCMDGRVYMDMCTDCEVRVHLYGWTCVRIVWCVYMEVCTDCEVCVHLYGWTCVRIVPQSRETPHR